MKTIEEPPVRTGEPRARRLGVFGGLLAISCCIYPVALALFGLAGTAEAIALGNRLFGVWGWAFKLGGGALVVAGIVLQLRHRGECSIDGARRNRRYILRVIVIGVAVYYAVYGITKALAAWGS